MEEIDDITLTRARQGDADAFEQILYAYERLIYSIAYHMTGNAEDARDITQESALKIYRSLPSCHETKGLKPWICKITQNTCLDHLRKRKSRPVVSYDAMLEQGNAAEREDSDPTPEQRMMSKESQRKILLAINKLPPEQRLVITLRGIKNMSYEEIAEITDTSLGTVKSRISRARASLRRELYFTEQKPSASRLNK